VRSRAVGLLVGALADAVFADPARWHPVAGFGSCAAAVERRWYADSRRAGRFRGKERLTRGRVIPSTPVMHCIAMQCTCTT
jgi:cobalamin biosynthesis protein CobD/CbiB